AHVACTLAGLVTADAVDAVPGGAIGRGRAWIPGVPPQLEDEDRARVLAVLRVVGENGSHRDRIPGDRDAGAEQSAHLEVRREALGLLLPARAGPREDVGRARVHREIVVA